MLLPTPVYDLLTCQGLWYNQAMKKNLNINRSEISRVTGADLGHVSRIFSRKANPSLPLAIKISDHLQITLDELCVILNLKPENQ